jgi:DNA-binding NtrC family response regulator
MRHSKMISAAVTGGNMSYLNSPAIRVPSHGQNDAALPRKPLLLIVEDGKDTAAALEPICDFLEIGIERVGAENDLQDALRGFSPMAVVAQFECNGQDGFHVMKVVAQHDNTLPMLLITGDEPQMAGAADAVEEIWALSNVLKCRNLPSVGALVDFLFKAGRKAGCTRFLPV